MEIFVVDFYQQPELPESKYPCQLNGKNDIMVNHLMKSSSRRDKVTNQEQKQHYKHQLALAKVKTAVFSLQSA